MSVADELGRIESALNRFEFPAGWPGDRSSLSHYVRGLVKTLDAELPGSTVRLVFAADEPFVSTDGSGGNGVVHAIVMVPDYSRKNGAGQGSAPQFSCTGVEGPHAHAGVLWKLAEVRWRAAQGFNDLPLVTHGLVQKRDSRVSLEKVAKALVHDPVIRLY